MCCIFIINRLSCLCKNSIIGWRFGRYNLDHPDDALLITASYKYLTELLINSDLTFLSNESKQLFKEHLEYKNIVVHDQSMLYTSAYIEFKAALNAEEIEQIPGLAYDYMQVLQPDIQKYTFYGFTNGTKNKLKLIYGFN